jgi:broad specificity phosphatase PhoE
MNLRLAAATCLLALTACAAPEPAPTSTATTTVVLVRHAQAVKNVDHAPDLTEEQLDVLTPLGREQAQALACELSARGVDQVVCSPTGRTRETAAAIAAAAGVTVVASASFSSFPSESVDDARRALAALEAYEGTTVVVTHGDVIAALTGEAAGTPPAERWARHEIPAAATVRLERRDGEWRVAR